MSVKDMKTARLNKLSAAIDVGQKKLGNMTSSEKKRLEKAWDVEHAYFSSALEGSRVSKKEFEKLAKKVN